MPQRKPFPQGPPTARASWRGVALGLALFTLTGCIEQREAEVLPETPSAACQDVAPRTLDEVYAAHFAGNLPTGCTVGCHESGSGGLSFRDARELWRATVQRPSTAEPTRLLVEPGRPERSHLYLKLSPSAASRMPQGGPYLSDAALRDVAGWICSGAPEPTGTAPDAGTSDNPPPRLDSLTPASVLVGAGEVVLTLNGAGFLASSQVSFDGAPIDATSASPEALSVRLPASVTSDSGTHRLRVTNPAPGGGVSAELTFTVLNPAPTLSGLNPSSVATQGAPFTLTLTGTGFTLASVVSLDGADVPTTYGSATSLTARIPSLTSARGYTVRARTPAPGGGTSTGLTLTAFDSNLPSITGLEPARATAEAAFTLTVTGSGYACSPTRAAVLFNGASYTASSCTATQLSAALPATPAGDYSLQVRNANGDTSNGVTLTLSAPNPVPTLGALSPSQGAVGGTSFTLRATGTGFVPGATLSFNGGVRSTTHVSATEVTAAIPASDLAAAGSFPVVVTNPAPGGGASNSVSFTVSAPNPQPAVSSLSPCGTVAGSGAFTLILRGTGFVQGASVTFNNGPVTLLSTTATELRASIPASLVASAPADNAAAVLVTNPAPGGGASAPAYFGVATRTSTLAANVQPLFTNRCATSGCHASPATPVNLTSGRSYGELVGVPSSGGCSSRLRVLACGPRREQSFLIDKLLATNSSPACSGSPMPKGSPLSAAEVQSIIDWVAQGAPP